MTREKTSPPAPSVPNQCSPEGGCKLAPLSGAMGSYGRGANKLAASRARMNSTPSAAPGCCLISRRMRTPRRGANATSLRMRNPRVEEEDDNIEQRVRDEGDGAGDQHHPLDHGNVEPQDALQRPRPQ